MNKNKPKKKPLTKHLTFTVRALHDGIHHSFGHWLLDFPSWNVEKFCTISLSSFLCCANFPHLSILNFEMFIWVLPLFASKRHTQLTPTVFGVNSDSCARDECALGVMETNYEAPPYLNHSQSRKTCEI